MLLFCLGTIRGWAGSGRSGLTEYNMKNVRAVGASAPPPPFPLPELTRSPQAALRIASAKFGGPVTPEQMVPALKVATPYRLLHISDN